MLGEYSEVLFGTYGMPARNSCTGCACQLVPAHPAVHTLSAAGTCSCWWVECLLPSGWVAADGVAPPRPWRARGSVSCVPAFTAKVGAKEECALGSSLKSRPYTWATRLGMAPAEAAQQKSALVHWSTVPLCTHPCSAISIFPLFDWAVTGSTCLPSPPFAHNSAISHNAMKRLNYLH